jgi:signal recognition particle subunit SRP19
MSHARIEEVSDSDPEIDDPGSFLPSTSQHALQPMDLDITPSAPASSSNSARNNPTLLSQPPTMTYQTTPPAQASASRAQIKTHCTLYPLYFDSSRSHTQGRRVSKSLAIPNPLAYTLLLALRHIFSTTPPHTPLQLTLEPDKTHPKDWANPGRVRVRLFSDAEEGHEPLHPAIPNKAKLYRLVGEYLRDQPPTRKEDPLDLKIPGLPVPENFLDEEAKVQAPRGWKMGSILPVHSAAVSGGGVSENFFKEAMEEMKAMQGAGGGAGGAGAGGGGMPDMAQLQQMMGSMGGMGGLANMMGGGGGGGPSGSGGAIESGKKGKKGKKG